LVCAEAADRTPAINKQAPIFFIGKPDAAGRYKVTKLIVSACPLK